MTPSVLRFFFFCNLVRGRERGRRERKKIKRKFFFPLLTTSRPCSRSAAPLALVFPLVFSPQLPRGLVKTPFSQQQLLLLESLDAEREGAPGYRKRRFFAFNLCWGAARKKKKGKRMDSTRLVLDKVNNGSFARLLFLRSVGELGRHHKAPVQAASRPIRGLGGLAKRRQVM